MPRAAAEAPPAKRARADARRERGTIARIRLHNFMSYRDAEIADPGTRLNCIVGPNGTGKSSIVCAMCVGLAGPLKITGRGDQVKSCVHGEGKQPDEHGHMIKSGFVETELVDGNGPGDNLVVRLDFDVDNKEKWQLNGRVAKKGEVKEAMAKLNIQVDNPLQFLPQDKVGEFSNLSPVKLLEHTEMAIGPETYEKHQRLIEDDKDLGLVKQRLVTERKALADLEEANRKQEQDVRRFKQLQENKRKLDSYRGKVLWVEASVLRQGADAAKAAHATVDGELKEVKNQVRAREAQCKPLEDQKAKFEAEAKKVNNERIKADAERRKWGDAAEGLGEEQGKLIDAIGSLDKGKERKAKKVADEQEKVDDTQRRLQAQREQLAEQNGRDPDEVKAEIAQRQKQAQIAARQADEALRDHKERRADLERDLTQADRALAQLNDAKTRKMNKVVQSNKQSAEAAYWVETQAPAVAKNGVVGPLIMFLDVQDRSHQPLVEEAIGPKLAFNGFLAKSDEARNAMTRHVQEQKWRVNVYKNSEGAFRPCPRPPSSAMKRFGVTKWLDEALTIPDEHRDSILSALKDLAQADRYLLATPKTMGCIEELQKYLAEQKMEMVTVLTPERTYRVSRSRYGARLLNATTQTPKPPQGLYSFSVDDSQREKLDAELEQARAAVHAHQQTEAQLGLALSEASAEKKAATEAMGTFSQGRSQLKLLEDRLKNFQQRRDVAQKELDDFDVSAKKAQLQGQLGVLARKEADGCAAMASAAAKIIELRTAECSASLAYAAAKYALTEAAENVVELRQALDDKRKERDEAERALKEKTQAHTAKVAEARKAAAHLEPDKASGIRKPAAQKEWDAMPNDLDELSTEISDLEEEINASDDDGGKALRDYEQRLKDIEAGTGKVGETEDEVSSKQSALDALTAKWKPELERLVAVVNDNFSDYFKRFKCCGEVALSDGRKLNPQTNQPEGPDDFSQYKILIKVQWRNTEDLHVLGEGGRDSGGERSVATMVYLISLQTINPAPFRVVDEINQAMDSTNERNVFECITHACREGGKQYFLLTPKLLPDLEYGEETCIQLVLNGTYNLNASQMTLADWV